MQFNEKGEGKFSAVPEDHCMELVERLLSCQINTKDAESIFKDVRLRQYPTPEFNLS
jgi:hypothetical protein